MAARVLSAVRTAKAASMAIGAAILMVACGVPPDPAGLQARAPSTPSAAVPAASVPDTAASAAAPSPAAASPAELVDRQLPPPESDPIDDGFPATVGPVPLEVVARSTWTEDCPVGLDELRYVSVPFRGFDGHTYVGEMIVHADVAADVASVFEQLYDLGFPIEEMRVVAPAELDAPRTGDGNNTTAFVCRSTTLGGSWSEHAYGLAVDVNPFHNPYLRDDIVIPELATAYVDRDHARPGMIHSGDAIIAAFAEIGWAWGGHWKSLKDWMHFSRSGR